MLVVKHLHNLLRQIAAEKTAEIRKQCDLGDESVRQTINGLREPTIAEKRVFEEVFGIPAETLFRNLKRFEGWELKISFEKVSQKVTKV